MFGLDHLFGFQTQIFIWNPNEIITISETVWNPNVLKPNHYGLSEIRTRSDLGRWLYVTNSFSSRDRLAQLGECLPTNAGILVWFSWMEILVRYEPRSANQPLSTNVGHHTQTCAGHLNVSSCPTTRTCLRGRQTKKIVKWQWIQYFQLIMFLVIKLDFLSCGKLC